MEGRHKAQAAWWVYGRSRLLLESLDLDASPSEQGDLLVHAAGSFRGRVTGLSPAGQGVQFELELEGVSYTIELATVFDVEVLPSGESTVQFTGVLVPMGEPGKEARGGDP